jgi:hypothetical protein
VQSEARAKLELQGISARKEPSKQRERESMRKEKREKRTWGP